MKSLSMIIICLVLLAVSACSTEVPEGYVLVCSVDGGKVTFNHPDGHTSPNVWETKWGAASFVRRWDKAKDVPVVSESDEYAWVQCK